MVGKRLFYWQKELTGLLTEGFRLMAAALVWEASRQTMAEQTKMVLCQLKNWVSSCLNSTKSLSFADELSLEALDVIRSHHLAQQE